MGWGWSQGLRGWGFYTTPMEESRAYEVASLDGESDGAC